MKFEKIEMFICRVFWSAILFLSVGCATTDQKTEFALRDYKEIQLENGLKVLLVDDQSLPYFSLNLLFSTGSRDDGESREGLANLVGEMLTKGTRDLSALSFADELGQIGADMTIDVGNDSTLVAASSLSFDQERMLDLFSKMVLQPAFAKTEIDRLKKKMIAGLQRQIDNPERMAAMAFTRFIYEGNAYAHPVSGTRSSVDSIQPKHINRFYLSQYRPNKATLAVVGKLSPRIEEMVRERFEGWQSRSLEKDHVIAFPTFDGRKIRLVFREDLKQSQVRVGWAGIKRSNPEFLKIQLANTILGGAFASRLSDRIRVELGLTYGVYSYFSAKKDQGAFVVSTSTRNDKVGVMVGEIFSVLEKFYKKGVSDKEVLQAKGLMTGRFPRSIETAEALASQVQSLQFYGVDEKYLSRYLTNLHSLKTSEINEVIKKYFNPTNAKVLVYGPKKTARQLNELAPLEKVSYEEIGL